MLAYETITLYNFKASTWFVGEPSKARWEIDVILPFGFYRVRAGNYEGYHNIFLFEYEARRKNTERPDVPYQVSIFRLKKRSD